jgi:hypothetical protein
MLPVEKNFAPCLGFTPNILTNEEQQSLRPVDYRNIGKIPGKVLNSEEVREEIRI